MYRVFVMTSNRYLHAVEPFAYMFNRYWSPLQPVVVCGFDPPPCDLPDNFSFFSIGPQSDYPFHRWSDALICTLQSFPKDEIFVLMLEDYWLIQPARLSIIRQAEDYMRQFRYVLKFDLCGDRRFAAGATPYGELAGIPLVKSDPNSPYHMSLMTGLWNRDLLLRVLIPGESPHDIEIIGTGRLAAWGDRMVVVGAEADPWPVRHTLAYRGNDPNRLLLDEISAEDLAIMRELHLIPEASHG